jgi:hypothetical protein
MSYFLSTSVFIRDRITTLETLAKLRPAFREGGTITAGNAPGLNSGAAAMIVAGRAFAEAKSVEPMAWLIAYGIAAVEPGMFGLGPIPAVRKALQRAGWNLGEVEHIEINEAFAAVPPAVAKELGLPEDIINVEAAPSRTVTRSERPGRCSRPASSTPCGVMVSSAASLRCASAVARASRWPSRRSPNQL